MSEKPNLTQPMIDLRYQPSPDILRLFAIYKPDVVDPDQAHSESWLALAATVLAKSSALLLSFFDWLYF